MVGAAGERARHLRINDPPLPEVGCCDDATAAAAAAAIIRWLLVARDIFRCAPRLMRINNQRKIGKMKKLPLSLLLLLLIVVGVSFPCGLSHVSLTRLALATSYARRRVSFLSLSLSLFTVVKQRTTALAATWRSPPRVLAVRGGIVELYQVRKRAKNKSKKEAQPNRTNISSLPIAASPASAEMGRGAGKKSGRKENRKKKKGPRPS